MYISEIEGEFFVKIKSRISLVLMIAGASLFGTATGASASEDMRLFSSWPGSSHEQAGRFEVGPFVGYQMFEKKQNLEDGLNYGGRLGYNFTNRFGVEIGMGLIDTNVRDKSKVGVQKGQYRSPTDSVDIKSYQLDAVYQFHPSRRLSPFVKAGIGRNVYDPQVLSNSSNTINYGVGVKYWIKKDLAVRIDLQDQKEKSFHNYSGTVQLVYAFGSRRSSKKAAVVASPEPHEVPYVEPKQVVLESSPSPRIEEVEEIVVERKPNVVVLAFEDIHFNFDSSALTKDAQGILQRSLKLLRDNPETKVRIAGYTSASGSPEYNQKLSERRAGAVKKYLLDKGNISPERLSTVGYGETEPAEHEVSPDEKHSLAARANMRVLFETILIN